MCTCSVAWNVERGVWGGVYGVVLRGAWDMVCIICKYYIYLQIMSFIIRYIPFFVNKYNLTFCELLWFLHYRCSERGSVGILTKIPTSLGESSKSVGRPLKGFLYFPCITAKIV